MPHRKTRLKLTGDTHPPEVEYDLLDGDDEPLEPQAETRAFTRRFDDGRGIELSPSATGVRRQVMAPFPFRTIAITLATLFVIGKLLRR